MYLLDYSINNMTLLALTLSSVSWSTTPSSCWKTSFVNRTRHEAVRGGAERARAKIGFTIISITFSLIAVFIPVLLMGGIVGRVFREFAVTIAVAIIVSGFVSLTLTPMLCARVLKAHDPARKENFILRAFRAHVLGLARRLRMGARQGAGAQGADADRHARHAGWKRSRCISRFRRAFFPAGKIPVSSPASPKPPPIRRSKAMKVRQQALVQVLKSDPAVDYINSTVGSGGPNPTANYGRLFHCAETAERT